MNELSLVLKCHPQNVFTNHIYLIYMQKEEFPLNPLQWLMCHKTKGGARGVMVIVVGIGHDDTSSNPGRD